MRRVGACGWHGRTRHDVVGVVALEALRQEGVGAWSHNAGMGASGAAATGPDQTRPGPDPDRTRTRHGMTRGDDACKA